MERWQTNYADELYHHGVKGMRWGVRKQRERSSLGSRFRASVKRKVREAKERKITARRNRILKDPVQLNKHRDEFSNDEIKQALARFDLEEKLVNASVTRIQRGAKWFSQAADYTTDVYITANQIDNIVGLLTGKYLFPGQPDSKRRKGGDSK